MACVDRVWNRHWEQTGELGGVELRCSLALASLLLWGKSECTGEWRSTEQEVFGRLDNSTFRAVLWFQLHKWGFLFSVSHKQRELIWICMFVLSLKLIPVLTLIPPPQNEDYYFFTYFTKNMATVVNVFHRIYSATNTNGFGEELDCLVNRLRVSMHQLPGSSEWRFLPVLYRQELSCGDKHLEQMDRFPGGRKKWLFLGIQTLRLKFQGFSFISTRPN